MITPRKGLFVVALVLLLCAVVNARWTRWLTRPVTNVVETTQWPAGWVASRWKTAPPVVQRDLNMQDLRDELRETQRYNAELWEQNTQLQQKINTYEAMSHYRDMKAIRPVEAPVSAFADDPVNPTMKLLRGSLHGIKVGDAVTYRENLLGFIEAVGPVTSTVQLITRKDFRSQVKIWPPGMVRPERGWPLNARANYLGKGLFVAEKLDYRQVDGFLQPGDFVRISDPLRESADGFLLGEIQRIEKDPEQPKMLRRLVIVPQTPIGPQREVIVITQRTD